MPVKFFLIILLAGGVWAAPGKLAIEHASVHNAEDGPDLPASYRFRPGDLVHFSFRVSGYEKKDEDDSTRVRLSWRVTVEDSNGVPLVEGSSGKVDTLVSTEDKDWTPVGRHTFALGAYTPEGTYRVLLRVKDELSGNEASSEITLRVNGHAFAPSSTLTLRNFRFYRSEEDTTPLEIAAYRPGDTLWARFDITGYTLGEKNRFEVEYGIRVLRADETQAYAEPNAATESGAPFYPQLYVPGRFSLNIPKDLKTGEYTLAVDVSDHTGNQTYEATAKFSVE